MALVAVGAGQAKGEQRALFEADPAVHKGLVDLANDEADRIQVAQRLLDDSRGERGVTAERVP